MAFFTGKFDSSNYARKKPNINSKKLSITRKKIAATILLFFLIIATTPPLLAIPSLSSTNKYLTISIRGRGVRKHTSYTLEGLLTEMVSHSSYIVKKEKRNSPQSDEQKIRARADFIQTGIFLSSDPRYIYIYIPNSVIVENEKIVMGKAVLEEKKEKNGYNIYEFKLTAEPTSLWGKIRIQKQWIIDVEFEIERLEDAAHHSLVMIDESGEKIEESDIEKIIGYLNTAKNLLENVTKIITRNVTGDPLAIADDTANAVKDILAGDRTAEILIESKTADLVVEEVWWEPRNPEENEEIELYYKIKNVGAEKAGSSNLRIYFRAGPHSDESVDSLESGHEITKVCSKNIVLSPIKSELLSEHYITFSLDLENKIPEMDENNTVSINYNDIVDGKAYKRKLETQKDSFSVFPESIKKLFNRIITFLTKTIPDFFRSVIPFLEKTPDSMEKRAMKEVRKDLNTLSRWVSFISKFNKTFSGISGEKIPEEEFEFKFEFKIVGAKFFHSLEEAETYMKAQSISNIDMGDALTIITELNMEQPGFCIVIVEYHAVIAGDVEEGRYPIVCDEKGTPFWKSWHLYKRIQELYEEIQEKSYIIN